MVSKTVYVVLSLVQKQTLQVGSPYNLKQELALTWADGMIGVVPVFRNKKSAEKYVKSQTNKYEIFAMESPNGLPK